MILTKKFSATAEKIGESCHCDPEGNALHVFTKQKMWIKEKHILASFWPHFAPSPCVAEQSQMRLTRKIWSS